jgi:hypothetical protein
MRTREGRGGVRHLPAALVAVAFVLPLVFMVIGSLRKAGLPPPRTVELVPSPLALENYRRAFELVDIPRYLLNSSVLAAIVVPLTVLHAADQLAAVTPEEVEVHNADLVEGMREYADALDASVRAASRNDTAALERFGNVSTNPGIREMAEAAEEMKHKGYDLGPIAEE